MGNAIRTVFNFFVSIFEILISLELREVLDPKFLEEDSL